MIIFRTIKKFRGILNYHQKIRILELGVLMVFGAFLETLSVSLVLPFMNAVMDSEATMKTWYGYLFSELFHIRTARTVLIILAVMLSVAYIVKNVYLLFEYNMLTRFTHNNQAITQRKLLETYLHRPYEYFLGVSSGEVLRVIGMDTQGSFSLLRALLTFFAELFVSMTLIVAVFVVSPIVTIGMAVIILLLLLIIVKIVKPILRKAGVDSQNAMSHMNKWEIQSVQGIREVKIMRREDYFEDRFGKYSWMYAQASRKNIIFSMASKFMIEAIGMSALFLMIAVMIFAGTNLESLVPIISMIAMAAIRILPGVNRMSTAIAQCAYFEPQLDSLIEHLAENDRARERHIGERESVLRTEETIHVLKNNLALSNITYQYPTAETPVLFEANMNIQKGMSIGIVGASGAGKTTAIDVFLGLLRPQRGQVLIDGIDIRTDMDGWLSQIGYVPQNIFLLDDSIHANVAFGLATKDVDEEKIWKALDEAALTEFVKSLPHGLDTQLGERGIRLSGGQRQRIGIARALYHDPAILVLDEATSALDSETETEIMESINGLHGQKTMIIIAHRLTTIANCDVIYRVGGGKIVEETEA